MIFYVAPWVRYQPYLVGIMLGYILHHLRGQPVKMRKEVNIFMWEAAFLTGFAVVYGLYDFRKTHQMSLFVATMYNTFQRLAWSLALAWVIFSCSKGYGGIINELLSWSVFAPLSRLTFCSYLIHMNIIDMFSSSVLYSFPNDTEIWSLVWYYLALQLVTCVVAFGLVLAFELPASRTEKVIMDLILSPFVKKETAAKVENVLAEGDKNKITHLSNRKEQGNVKTEYNQATPNGKEVVENDEHAPSETNSDTGSDQNSDSTKSNPPPYEQITSQGDQIQKQI